MINERLHQWFLICLCRFIYGLAPFFKTRAYNVFWRIRPIDADFDWQKETEKDYRKWIAREVCQPLAPNAVFEFGCGAGQNLAAISRSAKCRLVGVDINRARICLGRRMFIAQGITGELYVDSKPFSRFSADEFDASLTCVTLLYLGEDLILKVLSELLRITRKRVLLLEFHNPLADNDYVRNGKDGFVWNYEQLLMRLGYRGIATKLPTNIIPSVGRWSKYAYLIRVEK